MMKTKLTLFVAVLAAALFGMGCASVPKPDVADAVKWNGHWYKLYSFQDAQTWREAKKHCEELGGHLVYVESKGEEDFLLNNFISKLPNSDSVWLGATDEAKEGDWQWINGKSLDDTYQNFRSYAGYDQPDDLRGQDYLRIHSNGYWDDIGEGTFNGLMHSICEWE